MNSKHLDDDLIRKLYCDDQKSTRDIGKMLGVDGRTIARHLKKMGVKLRSTSEALKGRKSTFAGKHHTEETKRKISEAKKGKPLPKVSEAAKKRTGAKNPAWKGGVSFIGQNFRTSVEYQLWRKACLERDNFTCQVCGKHGGKLEVHHLYSFTEFPELRLAIDNGITLCKECHKKFHDMYGRHNNTKEQFEDFLRWTRHLHS